MTGHYADESIYEHKRFNEPIDADDRKGWEK